MSPISWLILLTCLLIVILLVSSNLNNQTPQIGTNNPSVMTSVTNWNW